MGGRLDATNVVDPLLSVITDISLDHTEYLGATIDAIAREKAGIIRPNGTLITLPQHPAANQVLGEVAVSLGARGVNAAPYLPYLNPTQAGPRNHYSLNVLDEHIQVDLPLAGSHQQRNLALAIAAAIELRNQYSYKLAAAEIARGIHSTRWPARLERIQHDAHADILIDVAHNPAGAWALRSALSHFDPAPPSMTLIFSCLRDKALDEMAQILFPAFNHVVLTQVASPRAATLQSLRAAAESIHASIAEAPDPGDALKLALELTPTTGLIVIAGSVYLAGELRAKALRS
jgi:dihydrofolate synthase/folylpolyglutamate synthase